MSIGIPNFVRKKTARRRSFGFRSSLSAPSRFAPGLCLVFLNGQPLHVCVVVCAAAFQRGDVVDFVAWTWAAPVVVGWAVVVSLEFVARWLASC